MIQRKAAGVDLPSKSWAEPLGQVIADLELLNRSTEQDFLRIGGKLGEFIGAVALISSDLTALASWEYGPDACRALTCVLDRSTEMSERDADRNRALRGMRQDAGLLNQTLSGFHEIVARFRTLGVLTRIETARLGGAGIDFGNLAEDMKLLAGNVETKVEGALDAAALLIPPIEGAIRDISDLGAGQAKNLPEVVAGVTASLASLHDMQVKAHDSSVRLGVQYAAISDAFTKMIMSIQFHDITRQQVEHVIEMMRSLGSESEGMAGGTSHASRNSATVLALLSSQLADAGEKFATSVASVEHSLDDIARHVKDMPEESRALFGLSEVDKNSFLLQMEQGCTAILASLRRCADMESTTRVTIGGLAETLDRMLGSIGEIRSIEIQMNRMALNASIRAAQVGAPGDALGVLSYAMQQGAFECGQRSASLFKSLGSLSEASARLSGQGAMDAAGKDGHLELMGAEVLKLHASSERSYALIDGLLARGVRLHEDLAATRQGFSVGALFADTINRARAVLNAPGEQAQLDCSREGHEGHDPTLPAFAMNYTMQAERDVYDGVTRAAGATARVAAGFETPMERPHWDDAKRIWIEPPTGPDGRSGGLLDSSNHAIQSAFTESFGTSEAVSVMELSAEQPEDSQVASAVAIELPEILRADTGELGDNVEFF